MLLSIDDMVTLIRSSVNVQVPDEEGGTTTDSNYLVMTDDDIKLFIKLGVTRAYPDVENLDELPDGCEFALVLLAKIELYQKLAVLRSDKVDLTADNNNSIRLSQRFDHYMKLAEDAKAQYDDWLENESETGNNVVNTYDVLLSKWHYSHRNYEKQQTPKVRIYIDEVLDSSVKFHWKVTNTSHFGRYKVYMGTQAIVDFFADYPYSDKISDNATLVKSTGDFRDTYHEVSNLAPETTYYIAVVSIERNQVYGLTEISFTTLEDVADEENVVVSDL